MDAAHSWNKHDIIARFMTFVHESGFCCMVHMYFHFDELGTIFYDNKVNLRMGSNGKSLDITESQGIPPQIRTMIILVSNIPSSDYETSNICPVRMSNCEI